jgi:hypothetical protein
MRDAMMRAASIPDGKGGYVGWLRRIALAYPLEFAITETLGSAKTWHHRR